MKVADNADEFLLVHGTWARGILPFGLSSVASWCRQDSMLCRALREASPGAKIHTVEWSGQNSSKERLKASEKIVERLQSINRERPAAKVHIVAHSHGGNAALYALKHPQNQVNIGSLTCLSTPFLILQKRKFSSIYQSRVSLIYSIYATIVMGLIAVSIFPFSARSFGLSVFRAFSGWRSLAF